MPQLSFSGLSFWYIATLLLVTVDHGIRGCQTNYIARMEKLKEKLEEKCPRQEEYPKQKYLFYSIHDGVFHAICSVAGFFAWWLSYQLYKSMISPAVSPDSGRLVLLSFLCVFGLVGVTGYLPQWIQQGKVPGK